jgi:hypothetical protein
VPHDGLRGEVRHGHRRAVAFRQSRAGHFLLDLFGQPRGLLHDPKGELKFREKKV